MIDFIINLLKNEKIVDISEFLVSFAALITSIGVSRRAKKLTEGQLEFQMAMWLRDSMHAFFEASLECNEYKYKWECIPENHNKDINENSEYRILHNRKLVQTEACLNAYEEACAKYLDKKLDRTRFKRSYATPIKDIFGEESFSDKLYSGEYPCLNQVYKHWNTGAPLWKIRLINKINSFLSQ